LLPDKDRKDRPLTKVIPIVFCQFFDTMFCIFMHFKA
jgi:hypothetical protein